MVKIYLDSFFSNPTPDNISELDKCSFTQAGIILPGIALPGIALPGIAFFNIPYSLKGITKSLQFSMPVSKYNSLNFRYHSS